MNDFDILQKSLTDGWQSLVSLSDSMIKYIEAEERLAESKEKLADAEEELEYPFLDEFR